MTDPENRLRSSSAPHPADGESDRIVPPPRSAGVTLTLAWSLTVAVSAVPVIAWTQLPGGAPAWLPCAQVAAAVLLAVSAVWWAPARPLWRFAVAMAALTAVAQALPALTSALAPLGAAAGSEPFVSRMVAEQSAKLVGAAVMIGVLLLVGLRRRQFFLAVGDLDAPMRPARLLGFPRPDPWWKFGLVWGIGIAAVLFAAQWIIVRPSATQVAGILPLLPAILLFASLNAFSEEMTYRAPIISTLQPPLGDSAALWQSAFFFGVAHYFGVPGGLVGAVVSVFMGWILGKAMIETRGLFWPWLIHVLSDIAIFSFLAMSLA
jgi:membrane protease YdiL (CAAX protease family)